MSKKDIHYVINAPHNIIMYNLHNPSSFTLRFNSFLGVILTQQLFQLFSWKLIKGEIIPNKYVSVWCFTRRFWASMKWRACFCSYHDSVQNHVTLKRQRWLIEVQVCADWPNNLSDVLNVQLNLNWQITTFLLFMHNKGYFQKHE